MAMDMAASSKRTTCPPSSAAAPVRKRSRRSGPRTRGPWRRRPTSLCRRFPRRELRSVSRPTRGSRGIMTHQSAMRALIVFLPLFAMTGLVRAEPPKDEKARAEAFRAFAKREAAAYTIRLEGSDRPLTFRPESVLTWSNPVMGTIYGEVFVWTADGRPEAVASLYRFYSGVPHRDNEFHSLALGK